jgi:hypothetical protein
MFLILIGRLNNIITSEMDDFGHFRPVRLLPFV